MRSFRLGVVLFSLSSLVAYAQESAVPAVRQTVPAQTLAANGAVVAIDLRNHLHVVGVTREVVQFETDLGRFNVQLRSDAAPNHARNFLEYVRPGLYNGSLIHRTDRFEVTGETRTGMSIVQGGGYRGSVPTLSAIPRNAPVNLEYSLPNARGTLAAARTDDVNSATNEWFFNTHNNSTILGPQNGAGGYSVFGEVLGGGMSVLDAIAALGRVNAGAPFAQLPVRNFSGGTLSNSNLVFVNRITEIPIYPTGSESALLRFTVTSQNTGVVNASITGSTLLLTPVARGTTTVTVRAVDVHDAAATLPITVTVGDPVAPSFTFQPTSQTVVAGGTAVLTATAPSASSYRWERNGVAIAGATNATLVLNNVTAAQAGTYTVVATNSVGSTVSSAATLNVVNATPAETGRLVNLAIRSNSGTGDQVLIAGFTVGGGSTGSAPLLLRGVGPSLTPLGVGGALADPVARVFRGTTAVTENDNWSGNADVAARSTAVNAFALTSNSDAALATSLTPAAYTMQVSGVNQTTGIALAEIYDATSDASVTADTPRLINVSARTQVGANAETLIAGFVIRGTTSKTVLIRAIGPGLTQFGVGNVLADPNLRLFRGSTLLNENEDWSGDPQLTTTSQRVGAFTLTNATSKDAMLLVTLPPGIYTAQVSGTGSATGVALVEVYEVP